MMWPSILENARLRSAHGLQRDCTAALEKWLNSTAKNTARSDAELARWVLTENAASLRERWIRRLEEVVGEVVGPIWTRMNTAIDADGASGDLDTSAFRDLAFEGAELVASVLSSPHVRSDFADMARDSMARRAHELTNEDDYPPDSYGDDIELMPYWEWLGGYLAFPHWEKDRDGCITVTRIEGGQYDRGDGLTEKARPYYIHRPAGPASYLMVFAASLWESEWREDAAQEKNGIDRGLDLVGLTARSRAPLEHFPLPTDATAVRVVTLVSGGAQGGESIGGVRIAQPSAILVKWPDEESAIQLPFPWDGSDTEGGPLVETGRRYGADALAFLLSVITLHWTQGDITNDPHARIALYPSEVAWLMGVQKLRPSWEHYADLFGRTILTARYPDGGTEEGPFLQVAMTTRNGRGGVESVWASLHPALTYPSAKGGFYWPAHRRLLRSDISTGHRADSHALAVLLGQQWSLSRSKGREVVFAKKATSLAEQLGIRARQDRRHDSRVFDRLSRAIAPLQAEGFVDRFHIVDGVVRAWPGEMRDEKPKRVSRLPSTGAELARWVAANGGPTEAARRLEKGRATIYRAMKLSHRQIPPSVRTAIRDYCWASPEHDEP